MSSERSNTEQRTPVQDVGSSEHSESVTYWTGGSGGDFLSLWHVALGVEQLQEEASEQRASLSGS